MNDVKLNSRLDKLSSPAFLGAIFLLLLNDFFLKAKYGNWLTGKISDFVGLYAITIFTIALLPKFKRTLLSVILVLFIFWKSIYSEQLIVFLKTYNIPFTRTSDLTDLIAIPFVFLAAANFDKLRQMRASKMVSNLIVCISCFAFMATSYAKPLTPEEAKVMNEILPIWPREIEKFSYSGVRYYIRESKKSFETRYVNNKDFLFGSHWPIAPIFLVPFIPNNYSLTYKDYSCSPYRVIRDIRNYNKEKELARISTFPLLLNSTFTLEEDGDNLIVRPKEIVICNYKDKNKISSLQALKEFEKIIIDQLPVKSSN